MKTLLKTLFFFLLTAQICVGQWNQLSPTIPGGIVKDVIVYGDTIVVGLHSFYSSEMGVYGSTDRGVSWKSLGLDDVPVWSLAKCGSNLLVGTWYSGIYRSSDWGDNWENSIEGRIIYSIAVDGSNVYAGTNGGGIYVSTNKGNSWNQMGSPSAWVDGGIAITDQYIFAFVFTHPLYRKLKSSGGWVTVSSPADTLQLSAEIFAHGSSIFIPTYGGLFVSHDYGNSWIKSDNSLPQGYQVEHLCSVEDKILCNVNGDIYSSTDIGLSWQFLASTPYTDHNTRLATNGTLLVMETKGSGLYVSEDFGGSWNERGIIPGYITSLLSRGNILFLSSSTGGVYSSSDHGENWLPVKTGMGSAWISELSDNETTIFAGARDGSFDGARDGIFRSFDEGETWEPDSIYNYYSNVMMIRTIDSLAFMRVRYDYMMGSIFIIYLSTDRGDNWIELNSLGSFSDFGADGSMLFGGSGEFADCCDPGGVGTISPPWGVYFSLDEGYTWETTSFPEQQVLSLAVKGNSIAVASKWLDTASIQHNDFHLSTDNGNSWTTFNTGINGEGLDLIWIGNNLIASTNVGIFCLRSGSNTWSPISDGLNDSIVGSLTIHNNELFLIGSSRSIWHRPISEFTSVEEEKIDELPSKFLLLQNFPNPFNPITKIEYSIPQASNVVIKVFDILGNEIETLVNEEKPVGTYKLTWLAENLPSGVYFYQLRAGNFIETKKMLLLK